MPGIRDLDKTKILPITMFLFLFAAALAGTVRFSAPSIPVPVSIDLAAYDHFYSQGWQYIDQKNYTAARDMFLKCLKIKPDASLECCCMDRDTGPRL